MMGDNKELMATDQSMIALTMKGKLMKCGQEVHFMDIKDLFVQEGDVQSWKPIHVGSISTTKYRVGEQIFPFLVWLRNLHFMGN